MNADLEPELALQVSSGGDTALTQALNMRVGRTASFGSHHHFYNDTDTQYHPDTTDVICGMTPWLIATNDSSIPSGEHVSFKWTCPDDADMDAIEAAITGTEPFFITRWEFNSTDKTVTAFSDASTWWDQTDWQSMFVPYIPVSTHIDFTVLLESSSLYCFLPSANQHDWQRKVRPVRSGETVQINKEGDSCFIVLIGSAANVSGTTFNSKDFIEIKSSQATLTAEDDMFVTVIYK